MAFPVRNGIPVYSGPARFFHWLVVALLLAQIPIGFYMTYRAYEMPAGVDANGASKFGVFDGLTNTLYDSHKLIGVIILLAVVARLIYRLTKGAPPSDPSLAGWQKGLSHATHWSLYLLLLAVPIGGYIGVSYYGALSPFGIPLPAVTEKDQKFAEEIFELHETGAFILIALAALHIAATIYHRFVRKDRVVERMLPKSVA